MDRYIPPTLQQEQDAGLDEPPEDDKQAAKPGVRLDFSDGQAKLVSAFADLED